MPYYDDDDNKQYYLNVNEVFLSIDGEANLYHQGRFSIFLRLQGCNLVCNYCDTPHAIDKSKGEVIEVRSLAKKILSYKCSNLTITGGEPLLQKEELSVLLDIISKENDNMKIIFETNGTINPYDDEKKFSYIQNLFNSYICYVMDYKLKSSGCEDALNITNFLDLTEYDFVKFVVSDKDDILRAIHVKNKLKETINSNFVISPILGKMNPEIIIEILKAEKDYDFILSVQLHKLLNLKEGEENNGN